MCIYFVYVFYALKRGFQPYARNARDKTRLLFRRKPYHVTNSSHVIGHFLHTLRSLRKTLGWLRYVCCVVCVRLETALKGYSKPVFLEPDMSRSLYFSMPPPQIGGRKKCNLAVRPFNTYFAWRDSSLRIVDGFQWNLPQIFSHVRENCCRSFLGQRSKVKVPCVLQVCECYSGAGIHFDGVASPFTCISCVVWSRYWITGRFTMYFWWNILIACAVARPAIHCYCYSFFTYFRFLF